MSAPIDPMNLTPFLPIQGTNSWTDIPFKRTVLREPLWWQPGSRFVRFMEAGGFTYLNVDLPFIWNTEVSGLFWQKDHRDWQAAGAALLRYLDLPRIPYDQRNLIAHSHGMQVVLYACAQGLEIRNLVTVGGPVRKDMQTVAGLARSRIGYWHAISDPNDRTQAEGEWFDGAWRYQRTQPFANTNDSIPGISHSNVLYDPAYFDIWIQNRWIDMLRFPLTPTPPRTAA